MFLDKTKQPWPGRSHVREQAKGLILFDSFVGAIGWLASLPLSGRLGR